MQMNPYQVPQTNNYMPQYQTYQQAYNPMQNIQRFQQQQQPEQMQQGIFGKVVQSQDSIVANDVPMNGSVAFFPKSDLSEIYAKQWSADGTISTMVFKPVQNDSPNKLSQDTEKLKIGLSDEATEIFNKHFDTLFSKMEELEKKIDEKSLTKTNTRAKVSQD
uniref:Uncharacterized protein n=1 Tax=Siphoviridae sp. ct7EW56 TaxID=2827562 RepID=A0A8S5LS86_9CAUD|nr:MAG TPA: hypothetical protein [Siphoviridae sp. ct7EW56]